MNILSYPSPTHPAHDQIFAVSASRSLKIGQWSWLWNTVLHPTMIHQWKKAFLEGAADICEQVGKRAPEIDEETVRSLHAKIGELAAANDFLSGKLKPWTGR